jgi:hypothetical protein
MTFSGFGAVMSHYRFLPAAGGFLGILTGWIKTKQETN